MEGPYASIGVGRDFTGVYFNVARVSGVDVSVTMLLARPVKCWPQQLSTRTVRFGREAEKRRRTHSISADAVLCVTTRVLGTLDACVFAAATVAGAP